MTRSRPPRLALVVLRTFRVEDETLVGDIVEEFGARQSRLWLWRQVLGAVLAGPEARRRTGPLGPLRYPFRAVVPQANPP